MRLKKGSGTTEFLRLSLCLRCSSKQAGGAILEFLLILPILLALFAGMIDYGLGLFQRAVILDALRAGTRIGGSYKIDSQSVLPSATILRIEGGG